jgi:putative PIN family toxin of toxin-antitoxin system
MKVVFDTNVLLSIALESHQGSPYTIQQAFLNDQFELYVSEHILIELERNLYRPYFLNRIGKKNVSLFITTLRTLCIVIPHLTTIRGVASHPEDDAILSTAIDAQATYLVTGDKKLQSVKEFRKVIIVSPTEFVLILMQESDSVVIS